MTTLAQKLDRRMARRLADAACPGLGSWQPAWVIVDEPTVQYEFARERFLADVTDETKARVRRAADDLVAAWEKARVAYHREIGG